MNRKVPRISRRAWLLAKQNHIEVSNITPTGPDGRIIERDIFRELEKNYLAELPEKTVDEIDAEPAETLAKSTEFADVTVQENIVETFAEKIPELELAVKETAESEEVAEAEETVEEPEELPAEETSVEETAESEEVAEPEETVEEPEELPAEETSVEETAESEEVAEAEETVEEPEELPVEETSVEETAESEEVAEPEETIEEPEELPAEETSVEETAESEEVAEPEETIEEPEALPVEETSVEETAESEEVAEPEETIEEPEELPVEETSVEETAESEEVAEAEETVEEPEELPVEETSVEETAESVTETEDVPVAEPTEPVIEEISETEDEPEIEIEWIETEAEQTAIVAAPIKTIAKDNTQKETDSQETEQEKEKSRSYGTEAYRHTDVIIPRTESAPNGNPITLTMSFDAGAIVKLNTLIKEHGETMGLPHITINDMILFATAKLLKKNKALNAHFLGDKIRYFDGAHLGFSVDTGHGIETLTVFDADRLSLSSLAKITGALIRSVRAGGVSPEKNKLCASFMVSNLGTLGVESFTPVLKEPQTGVLGVCALQRRIKEVNGKDISYSCIPLSLTFDPRALDTTSAAGFLRELCVSLENFELLLIK
ncbi:MAG: hypothetical protein E7603_02990 [Ruminococcaceae bacterium]|nr:hypothetical protein [Oscillospiraceae bacterium]